MIYDELYKTQIKPLLSNAENLSFDELMYQLSENLMELRRSKTKTHFLDSNNLTDRKKLMAEMRTSACQTAAYCVGIVDYIDNKN